MFKPGDLPVGVRHYHVPPNLTALILPEYYPLFIGTRLSEELRLNSRFSRQSRFWWKKRLPNDLFKFHCAKRLI